MAETIQVGTIYLGKTVCIDIAKVSNDTGEPVTGVYVDITIPEGVTFSRASMGQGTYDAQILRWNVGTLLPLQTTNAEFCFEITEECLSSFRFDFAVGSTSACNQECLSLARECVILKGQSCCEIDNCGFSKFGSESYETQCPDSPLPEEPQAPPSNAINEQYHIEFYENCEIWWQYNSETTTWVIVNDVVAGSGTVSQITNVIDGHQIAVHDNGSNQVSLKETVTSVSEVISGNKIASYNDENGVANDINETITGIANTVVGHRIVTYNDEAGMAWDIYETNTAVSEDEKGIVYHTNESGNVTSFGKEMAAGAINHVFTSSNEFTVTFPFTFSSPPIVTITPAAPSSGLYEVRIESVSTTQFVAQATFISASGAPANYTSYHWIAINPNSVGTSPTPSPTPFVTMTPTVTPSTSVTPSVTPTVTITPTLSTTPSISITPTISVTPSITATSNPTPSVTPTVTITPSI